MSEEFTALIRRLKIPMLSDAEIAGLQQLEKEWSHWREREQEIVPARIAEEQRAAYESFVTSPIPENERRLTVLADPNLTGIRYALLRRAFADVRARLCAQAGQMLRPVMRRICAALEAEHAARLERAEPIMSSKLRNPIVMESRKAIEHADRLGGHIFTACGGKHGDQSPLELAGDLIALSASRPLTAKNGK